MSDWLPTVTHQALWSAGALLIYVVTAGSTRVRRPPTSSIAWVVSLALVPYVALPLYLIFGQRKARTVQLRKAMTLPLSQIHWAARTLNAMGVAPPVCSPVRFHADGREALSRLWEFIDSAGHHIEIATFLIADDAVGRELLNRLTDRARQGIRVRLLIDGAGRLLQGTPSVRKLRAAGGEVRLFHPLWGFGFGVPRNLRNHRKMLLVDGTRAWTGGRNFACEYFSDHRGKLAWKDLSFELSGPVVTAAGRQFELDWDAQGANRPLDINESTESDGSGGVQYVPSGPDRAEDTVHALLLTACFQAKRRLLAVTPYFVPGEKLQEALRLALLRGVELTLVLPHRSNHVLADLARMRALRELSEAGADIRLVPTMVHAKGFVVDDSLAISGSVNLDLRSLLLNYEADFVFYGEQEIAWLAAWIESLAGSGMRFVPSHPSWIRNIAEGLLLAVAFQI